MQAAIQKLMNTISLEILFTKPSSSLLMERGDHNLADFRGINAAVQSKCCW